MTILHDEELNLFPDLIFFKTNISLTIQGIIKNWKLNRALEAVQGAHQITQHAFCFNMNFF